MTTETETQVTGWMAYGHYGFAAYRIWTRVTGNLWEQRHEWKRDDGSIDMEGWIRGTGKHAEGSAQP